MSYLPPPPPTNPEAKRWIPVLVIGIVGILGLIAIFGLTPDLQLIEFTPLLLIVVFSAWGYLRGIVRGFMTLIIVYISTVAAASLYQSAAPYVGAVLELFKANLDVSVDDPATLGAKALTFCLLTAFFWIILELVRRAMFESPEIEGIGVLDNLGGVLIHLVLGILIASLLFNVVGYGRSRPKHDRAHFRTTFDQVIYLHYLTQSFFFGNNPPPIYIYDFDAL